MFQKGDTRPAGAGMQTGQKIRRTADTEAALGRVQEKYGCVLEALAEIAFDPINDISVRVQCLKELASYQHAKRKSIEVSGQLDDNHETRSALIQQITARYGEMARNLKAAEAAGFKVN
jgi:hypothetical protein